MCQRMSTLLQPPSNGPLWEKLPREKGNTWLNMTVCLRWATCKSHPYAIAKLLQSLSVIPKPRAPTQPKASGRPLSQQLPASETKSDFWRGFLCIKVPRLVDCFWDRSAIWSHLWWLLDSQLEAKKILSNPRQHLPRFASEWMVQMVQPQVPLLIIFHFSKTCSKHKVHTTAFGAASLGTADLTASFRWSSRWNGTNEMQKEKN